MTEDTFDPYAELGLERGATDAEVQAAYRRRAKKTHPDKAGGDEEAWASTCRALAVLEDPRRRKRYDETGAVDEGEPDNVKASALQLIENFIGTKVDGFLNDGKNDPRHHPALFVELTLLLRQEIRDAEAGIAKGKMVKVFVRDLGERFESAFPERPIERLFETRQRSIDAQIITLEEAIAARKIALEIVAGYNFDPSQERDLVHPIFAEEPE